MKKFFILIASLLFAIDIDISSLEKEINSNPYDIENRLILAKYYLDKNKTKALKFINEILKVDKNNKYAKKLLEIAQFTYSNADKKINELYNTQKYDELIKFFEKYSKYNNIKNLKDQALLNIAKVYMWKERYNDSLYILNFIKNKTNNDYYKILAYNYFYMGSNKAEKYLKLLYSNTGKIEYAKKLMEFYFMNKEFDKAEKFLYSIENENFFNEYYNRLKNEKEKYINNLYQKYKNQPTFKNLQPLFYVIYNKNKQKAYHLIENYIKNNPSDKNATIFYAQILTWNGNTNKALQYLKNINSIKAKLLIGKIYAWNGNYKKAKIYLNEVSKNGNKNQKYEASKMLGFIALWEGNKEKAKTIFKKLIKQNSNDTEIKETLMIINGKIKPLIKKYKKIKNPSDEIILKLANLYYQDNNYKKAAEFYKQYLKLHPESIEIYKTLGDVYLRLKDYDNAFKYLEKYAKIKNTKEAYLELAKRYYWSGFNQKAIFILNYLLKKYPNYKDAALLKAKISNRNQNLSLPVNIKLSEKQLKQLLAYGDEAYFNGFYATAIEYYKTYLIFNPNDYNTRERYAYALEYNKEYKKAAGEFFILMKNKHNNLIKYHYAYNLQKAGEINKAKKIYQEILSTFPKPIPVFIKNFLQKWKTAWQSKNFKKYSSFYDSKIKNNISWKKRKQNIFKHETFINVKIIDPILIKKQKNIYIIKFFQIYSSSHKKDKGYKTLWIQCKNKNNCKIIKEKWIPAQYHPYDKYHLKKYINDNLRIMNLQSSLNTSINNKINEKKISKFLYESNLSTPVKITSKKHILKEKEVLNYNLIKLKKVKKKEIVNVLKKHYENNLLYNENEYNNKNNLIYNLNFFKDNQQTKMITHYLEYKKNLKDVDIFAFSRWYKLYEKHSKKNGNYIGIGFKKNKFSFDIFKDNSGINTIGWDISYRFPYFLFNLNKHNLVYSRKTICASKYQRLKTEITDYKYKNKKEL
jgi:tetratricopeptide (TPR) repeat protein